jgi:hypothetical protein
VKRFFILTALSIGVFINFTPAFAELNFSGGGILRLRHEYWKNWKDMDSGLKDNRNFFRIKTSLWGKAALDKKAALYAKLTDEFRAYTYFGGTTSSVPDKTASKKGYHFDINEVVFDNLYLDVKQVFDAPVDLRIGRQDLLPSDYGEGFLFGDGTPLDSSRTYYFNAAKASWHIDENNTLDAILIDDPRDEEFLPVINRTMLVNASNPALDKVPQRLNTTDETGYVLYLKNKSVENLYAEGYYIYKTEAEEGGTGLQSQRTRLHTFGSFSKFNFSPYVLRGQLACQVGDYGDSGRRGLGGYVYVDRDFKNIPWSPLVSLGYIYLSGDKQGTDRNEAWDPLFSRYPWLSDLYCITLAGETGMTGYWTNFQWERASVTFYPTKKTKLQLMYNFLRANTQVAASSVFSGTSKSRGQLLQGKLSYEISKDIVSYFQAEYLIPGKFYAHQNKALFLRTEVMIKF